MTRVPLSLAVAAVVLQAGSGALDARAPGDALGFFKNYFITGDYVVGGVGVNGNGQGTIVVDGVPPDAELSAAYLYWQVVDKNNRGAEAGGIGATFRGHALSNADGSFGKLLAAGTAGCTSGGGGAGSNTTYSYRADVLRFFAVDAESGKLVANGGHAVTLPNGQGLDALGASLVVVYRQSSAPLSAVVFYDGAYTMSATDQVGMRQTIEGFYDAGAAGKITHIVGGGQSNTAEVLQYNGAIIPTPTSSNPFASARSAQWDNPTFEVTANPDLTAVTTSVDQGVGGFSSWGCLTWAAVVYRTTVKDFDGDGLLDRWETSDAPILDPFGQALPNLKAMGALPDRKDLFVEVGYMRTGPDDSTLASYSYGGVSRPPHSHLPTLEALQMMGEAFRTAPTPIAVHFDVGPHYQGAPDPYDYLIDPGLARGGEGIDEAVTQCTPGAGDPPWVCQFRAYPGTVGWKSGFRFLRDEVNNPPPLNPDGSDPCDVPGSTCERRFDRTRLQSFHYALFTHHIGLPESEKPCLVNGAPADDVNGVCSGGVNPLFLKPRTNTGIADFPGADIMVSLGGFDDLLGRPIGTPFMQASTLMHEFGHNAERRHGGEAFEQNCKPTYLSVMNYLYQLRGLLKDGGPPVLDFSGRTGDPVAEGALTGVSTPPYRIGWYAPLATSYLAGRGTAARRHCNGSDLVPTDVSMVRIDARAAADPVDWDADGNTTTAATALDVNFNGRVDPDELRASDDWSNLRLDQLGSRRNVGGLFVIPGTARFGVGPLSLDSGKGDLGKGDLGKGDLGKGDLGKGDLGKGDLGKGDLGKGDLGKGDLGKGDLGGGDLFVSNDPFNPGGELDAVTAGDLARTPPNEFTACVIGVGGCSGTAAQLHDVRVAWTPPTIGNVSSYTVYRVEGPELRLGAPPQVWSPVATVPVTLGQTAYAVVDGTSLTDDAEYTYFAVATYADAVVSDPSLAVTITAVNDPAAAADDSYATPEDTALTVAAPGVLGNDGDPDTAGVVLSAVLVTPPASGSLTLNANGGFTYTPAANAFGDVTFTYRATAAGGVVTNTATVTIAVTSVNDAPTISNITDRSIDLNGTSGPIAFTVGDDGGAAALTFTALSSNTTLVPVANVVFGGSDTSRTVTVTPAANQSGTATITVQVTDSGGLAASDTFVVTVTGPATFVNVQNAPPPSNKTFKSGSAIPMQWRYASGGTIVASGHLTFSVTVRGPLPATTLRNTDPGSSSFRYDAASKTWSFNLQTKEGGVNLPAPATYEVVIAPTNSSAFATAAFQVKLAK